MSRLLSLVVPVYYEEECIAEFIRRCIEELERNHLEFEIVLVDDGSDDRTVEIIRDACARDRRIRLVELSYNHGKQAAVTAGISLARGDLLLYMDPDLQDPPEEIIRFVNKIDEGYDLVFGVRREKKDSAVNVLCSRLFWLVIDTFTGLRLPRPLAVMRIFNREFAARFLEYREANRFIEGIFADVGMRQTSLLIEQSSRFAGRSKFNFFRRMRLAVDAILDYSELPLKVATRFGVALVVLAMIAIPTLVALRLFFVDFQLGWPSLILTLWMGFGIQLFFLGLLGSYIGKVYKETKRRPLFSTKRLTNFEP